MSVRIREEDANRFGIELQKAISANLAEGPQRDTLIELVVLLTRRPMPADFLNAGTMKLTADGIEREIGVDLTSADISDVYGIRQEMWEELEAKRISSLLNGTPKEKS